MSVVRVQCSAFQLNEHTPQGWQPILQRPARIVRVNLDNRVCIVDQRGAVRERKQTALEEIELRDAHVGVVEIERGESVVNAANDGGILHGNQDYNFQRDQIAMRERVVPFGTLETRGQARARNPLAHAAQFYHRPAGEKRGMQGVVQVGAPRRRRQSAKR